ncbi:hypothetical protein C4569_03775 [Candidatus Parcubacteria bacterium]|nr:MAG: hypothetical protein C4569_03775 [Candidatus Parcubacteria bacterium]
MHLKKSDRETIKKIKLLNQITPRKEWKDSFRALLISEIKKDACRKEKISLIQYTGIFIESFRLKLFQPAVSILLVMVLFLSSSFIVNAAFYSMPGDNLYDLKIALEKAQITITFDEGKKAELRMDFASNRIKEFEKIADLSTPLEQQQAVAVVTKKFKEDVRSINEHIFDLDQKKMPVFSLAKKVDAKAAEMAKNLTANRTKLSPTIIDQVEKAIDEAVLSAEDASDSAFKIAINSYDEEENISDDEVSLMIQTRIEKIEEEIKDIKDERADAVKERIENAKARLSENNLRGAADDLDLAQEIIDSMAEDETTENQEQDQVSLITPTTTINIGQVLGEATSTVENAVETTQILIEIK